jgi:hypothetical protein
MLRILDNGFNRFQVLRHASPGFCTVAILNGGQDLAVPYDGS